MKLLTNLKNNLIIPAYADVSGGDISQHTQSPFDDLGVLVTNLLNLAIIAAGLIVLGYFVLGGLLLMTAGGGDAENTAKGRKLLTNAVIGFMLIISTYAIMKVLEKVFGITILGGITLPRP